jgi:hypothetical protein
MKRLLLPITLLTVGLCLGLLSARYLMDTAQVSVAITGSAWREIQVGGDALSDTYATAHFLRRGEVPPPRATRIFVRDSDEDGNSLRGDCVVQIEGNVPAARWWFVAADNDSQRRTLDAAQTVRDTAGSFSMSIATTPVPGNWLVPPSSGGYVLQLVLIGTDDTPGTTALPLPTVKRLWC